MSELGIRGAAAPGGRLRRHHLHALHRRREGQGTGIDHTLGLFYKTLEVFIDLF